MERNHVFIILGSGLMVFSLAALSGALIFSPSPIIGKPWTTGVKNKDDNNNIHQDDQSKSLPLSSYSSDEFSLQHIAPPSDQIPTLPPLETENKDLNKNFSPTTLEDFSFRRITPPEKISNPISPPIKTLNKDFKSTSSIKNIENTAKVSSNLDYQPNKKIQYNTVTLNINNDKVALLSPQKNSKSSLYPKKSENNQKELTKNTTHLAPQHNMNYSRHNLSTSLRTKQLTPTQSNYYWIQFGSYSSLGRAKESQRLLKNLGISGNIEIYGLDNKYIYRLKVGAWLNKKEALNFVQHFKESYPMFSNDAFIVG